MVIVKLKGRKQPAIFLMILGIALFLVGFVHVVSRWSSTCSLDDISSADIYGETEINGEITNENLLGGFSTGGMFVDPEYFYFVALQNGGIVTVKVTDKDQIGTLQSIIDGNDGTLQLSASIAVMGSNERSMAVDSVKSLGICKENEVDIVLSPYILQNYTGKSNLGTNMLFAIATVFFLVGFLLLLPEISDLIFNRKKPAPPTPYNNSYYKDVATFYTSPDEPNGQYGTNAGSKYNPNVPYSGMNHSKYDPNIPYTDTGAMSNETGEVNGGFGGSGYNPLNEDESGWNVEDTGNTV